ncbi:MAG: PstS family phosphate ABC transporter substrate-binding protein [Candidatus Promineifilaceae bacterium]
MKSITISTLLLALVLSGCQWEGRETKSDSTAIIAVDGSSTVFPIAEAVAEEFGKTHKVRVTIGVSGSGGGFKKFCKQETAVSNASRPIKASEVKLCAENGVEYIELPVAYDGIAVVVHKDADWVDHMTVEELKKLWSPEAQGKITKWNQIRTDWPDKEIHLFGPGVDSGTYDYFTEAIVGKEHSSRGDFTSSEDDNVLVQGIATDPGALGFFGLAYYTENRDKLKVVPIEGGGGPIAPSLQTVGDGSYQPLSRPLFVYVNKQAAERKEVQAYIAYFLNQGRPLVKEVGYIPLPDRAYQLAQERFDRRITGSVFGGKGAQVGVTVEELLNKQ